VRIHVGVDVISAETIMNPVDVTDDYDKGKSSIRSPDVVTFLLSLRSVITTLPLIWSTLIF